MAAISATQIHFPTLAQPEGKPIEFTSYVACRKSSFVESANRGLVREDTRPHDLRHTFAHRYLQQHPGDLVGLARILGHESLDATKVYTQLTSEELAKRVEQIPLNAYG